MNPEMLKGQLRSLLIGVAGLVGGWFAAKGWITTEQVTAILSSPVAAALATMAAGFIWSAVTHTETNAVAVVNDIAKRPDSAVRGIITEPTHAGSELAASLPGPTVQAGTVEAKRIASGAS